MQHFRLNVPTAVLRQNEERHLVIVPVNDAHNSSPTRAFNPSFLFHDGPSGEPETVLLLARICGCSMCPDKRQTRWRKECPSTSVLSMQKVTSLMPLKFEPLLSPTDAWLDLDDSLFLRAPTVCNNKRGLEDLRLFRWMDRTWAIGNNPFPCPRMHVVELVGMEEGRPRLGSVFKLTNPPLDSSSQKNWGILVAPSNELLFVESVNPHTIYGLTPWAATSILSAADGTVGEADVVEKYKSDWPKDVPLPLGTEVRGGRPIAMDLSAFDPRLRGIALGICHARRATNKKQNGMAVPLYDMFFYAFRNEPPYQPIAITGPMDLKELGGRFRYYHQATTLGSNMESIVLGVGEDDCWGGLVQLPTAQVIAALKPNVGWTPDLPGCSPSAT